MNFFFNRRTLRKILAFYFIVENNGNVDLNNVSEYLKCTVRTTKDVLDELENDVKQWDSEVYLQQKSDGYLYVYIPSDLSIHGIYLYYLEDNINFNWMKQYFFENTVEINEYALEHYVSYSTMYKNMKVIDRNILSRYKLQFNTNVNATILGDEKQKRLFFFDFFWYSYSGLKWPFYNVEKKKFDIFFKYIEKIRVRNIGLSEKEILRYYFAIIFHRIEIGETCDESILKNQLLEDSKHYTILKESLFPIYKSIFPKLMKKDIESEIAFLYLTIFGLEFHLEDNAIVSEMLVYVQTHDINVVEYTNFWMKEFFLYFDIKLNAREYSILYSNLIHIHSRASLFEGIDSISEDIPGISKSKGPLTHIVNKFYEILVEKSTFENPLFENRVFLINKYSVLIEKYAGKKYLINHIKICLLSIYGGETSKDFNDLLRMNDLDQIVDVTISLSNDVDLIITDRVYDELKDTEIEMLLWEVNPSDRSKNRIIHRIKEIVDKRIR